MLEYELRSDKTLKISGYVNAVGRDSRPVMTSKGKVVEQIEPGAFGEALRAFPDVVMLLNHDHNRQLASVADGTLTLNEDSIGLRAEAVISDPEVMKKAREGRLRGWSFGFKCCADEIEQRSGKIPRRIVKRMSFDEVSVIDDRFNPCYAGTSVELRADEEIETEYRAYIDDIIATEVKPDYSYYEQALLDFDLNEYELRAGLPLTDRHSGMLKCITHARENKDDKEYCTERRMNDKHDPSNGQFAPKNGNSEKGIDKSEESGIMKSSEDFSYISATGPNEFEKGFSASNLADHWYGDEPRIHSHKEKYEKRGYDMKGYGERALDLVQKPTGNSILGHKTNDGLVIRYDTKTGDFVKGNPKKGIKTMFMASREYYDNQRKRDLEARK